MFYFIHYFTHHTYLFFLIATVIYHCIINFIRAIAYLDFVVHLSYPEKVQLRYQAGMPIEFFFFFGVELFL